MSQKWRNASPVIAKEDWGKAILGVYIAAKDVYPAFITNIMECVSFKGGCVVRVDLKEVWFIVLC